MLCPRCQGCNLKKGNTKKANVEIDYCPQCKGIWLDQRELELLSDNAITDLSIPSTAEKGQLLCPHCHSAMHEFHYPQTLTAIDMCRKCEGIWLDAGELKEIEIIRSNPTKKPKSPKKHHTAKHRNKAAPKQYFNHKWSNLIEKTIALIVIVAVAGGYLYLRYSSEKDYNQKVAAAREKIHKELQQISDYEDHAAAINRLIESNHETAKKHATHRSSSRGSGESRSHTRSFYSFQYDSKMLELMLAQVRNENNEQALTILVKCQNNREKEFKSKRNWYMNELDP